MCMYGCVFVDVGAFCLGTQKRLWSKVCEWEEDGGAVGGVIDDRRKENSSVQVH